jgi:hypothetical protein
MQRSERRGKYKFRMRVDADIGTRNNPLRGDDRLKYVTTPEIPETTKTRARAVSNVSSSSSPSSQKRPAATPEEGEFGSERKRPRVDEVRNGTSVPPPGSHRIKEEPRIKDEPRREESRNREVGSREDQRRREARGEPQVNGDDGDLEEGEVDD